MPKDDDRAFEGTVVPADRQLQTCSSMSLDLSIVVTFSRRHSVIVTFSNSLSLGRYYFLSVSLALVMM